MMRGAECQTDHQLLISCVKYELKAKRRCGPSTGVKKLKVRALRNGPTRVKLQEQMTERLQDHMACHCDNQNDEWCHLRDIMTETARGVLGPQMRKNPDWFSDNVGDLKPLIDEKDAAHKACLARRSRATAERFKVATARLRDATRRCQSEWIMKKATAIQACADANDAKGFHSLVNEVYGPRKKGFASLRSADNSELITDQEAVL